MRYPKGVTVSRVLSPNPGARRNAWKKLPQIPASAPLPGLGSRASVRYVPGKSQVTGGVDLPGLLSLVLVLAMVFWPVLLGRRGPPPGQSEPGSGDDRGDGPPPPGTPPRAPQGGIPLNDAEPARARLRDHRRLADRLPARDRRPTQVPDRPPARIVDQELQPAES